MFIASLALILILILLAAGVRVGFVSADDGNRQAPDDNRFGLAWGA